MVGVFSTRVREDSIDGMPPFGPLAAAAGLGFVAVLAYQFAFVDGGLKSTPNRAS
ncbi:hypothetical protein [Streptomyces mirabilis]